MYWVGHEFGVELGWKLEIEQHNPQPQTQFNSQLIPNPQPNLTPNPQPNLTPNPQLNVYAQTHSSLPRSLRTADHAV